MSSASSRSAQINESVRSNLKRFFRRFGYEVRKFNPQNVALARRMRLLSHYGIDLIFDVGANDGGYATEMRQHGYRGRIVSFEPQAAAFDELARHARKDPLWEVVHSALGREEATATLNVAESSACSSLLRVLPGSVDLIPQTAQVDTEEIAVTTLDAVFGRYYTGRENVYLKIDTQGYERNVLDGAADAMEHIVGVQLETALVPQYAGETLFDDILPYMMARGYALMSIETVLTHPVTGQLLQVDAIFYRAKPLRNVH